MKFLTVVAFAAGVIAQTTSPVPTSGSDDCLADYIVTRCLQTEKPKAEACDATDVVCQCRAYEAIATCYNNCPDDPRAAGALAQVSSYCAQVTTSSSSTRTRTTSTASSSTDTTMSTASATDDDGDVVRNTATFSAESPGETDAAGVLMRNTGGVLLGVAGVIAAVL